MAILRPLLDQLIRRHIRIFPVVVILSKSTTPYYYYFLFQNELELIKASARVSFVFFLFFKYADGKRNRIVVGRQSSHWNMANKQEPTGSRQLEYKLHTKRDTNLSPSNSSVISSSSRRFHHHHQLLLFILLDFALLC